MQHLYKLEGQGIQDMPQTSSNQPSHVGTHIPGQWPFQTETAIAPQAAENNTKRVETTSGGYTKQSAYKLTPLLDAY